MDYINPGYARAIRTVHAGSVGVETTLSASAVSCHNYDASPENVPSSVRCALARTRHGGLPELGESKMRRTLHGLNWGQISTTL